MEKFIFLIPLFWFLWWEVFLSQEMPSAPSLKQSFHFSWLAAFAVSPVHLSVPSSQCRVPHNSKYRSGSGMWAQVWWGCWKISSCSFFLKKANFYTNEQVKEIFLQTGKTKNIEKQMFWSIFSRVSRFFSLLSKSGGHVTWINCADALPSCIGQTYYCVLLFSVLLCKDVATRWSL